MATCDRRGAEGDNPEVVKNSFRKKGRTARPQATADNCAAGAGRSNPTRKKSRPPVATCDRRGAEGDNPEAMKNSFARKAETPAGNGGQLTAGAAMEKPPFATKKHLIIYCLYGMLYGHEGGDNGAFIIG